MIGDFKKSHYKAIYFLSDKKKQKTKRLCKKKKTGKTSEGCSPNAFAFKKIVIVA